MILTIFLFNTRQKIQYRLVPITHSLLFTALYDKGPNLKKAWTSNARVVQYDMIRPNCCYK